VSLQAHKLGEKIHQIDLEALDVKTVSEVKRFTVYRHIVLSILI